MKNTKTFKVTYTKRNDLEGSILVKATTAAQALTHAQELCATGSDFRDPFECDEKYIKPRKQGFYGHN